MRFVKGKATRVKFGKGLHISKAPLDNVHSDLLGLSKVSSNGGARYFRNIIDDILRREWVFTVKHKSEDFDRFKTWHTHF